MIKTLEELKTDYLEALMLKNCFTLHETIILAQRFPKESFTVDRYSDVAKDEVQFYWDKEKNMFVIQGRDDIPKKVALGSYSDDTFIRYKGSYARFANQQEEYQQQYEELKESLLGRQSVLELEQLIKDIDKYELLRKKLDISSNPIKSLYPYSYKFLTTLSFR